MSPVDVQEAMSQLLASGYPDIDVRQLPSGEHELHGYGALWCEQAPLGYGLLLAKPTGGPAERFEFYLDDHDTLVWALTAAVAYLMNPHERLSDAAPGYRP